MERTLDVMTNVYIHLCINVCVYTDKYIYACISLSLSLSIYLYIYIYIYMYVCI